MIQLIIGDCRDVMADMAENSVDAIICDPPYELNFMGKAWDRTGVAFQPETWALALRLLKPGGHLLAMGGTRTYHRMACAIDDAGFEVRDCVQWLCGSGFPKSRNISKAIDAEAGTEREVIGEGPFASRRPRADHSQQGLMFADDAYVRPAGHVITAPATDAAKQWDGWGTALKPACELICLARKPLSESTVAANVLRWGVGGLNVDGCRIGGEPWKAHRATGLAKVKFFTQGDAPKIDKAPHSLGRWPANVIHDGSEEVEAAFAEFGSVSRFFYCSKSSKTDRNDGLNGEANKHPTIKPTSLMRYLCRLITPPGGTVLDPFMGTGSTGRGAVLEGFDFIGIEMDPQWVDIAQKRIQAVMQGGTIDTVDHRSGTSRVDLRKPFEAPQACGPGGSEEPAEQPLSCPPVQD